MTSTEIRGRFLPSRVYNRWKWTVRFGLMLVPFVMLLSGGIEVYLSANKYRSGVLFGLENGPPPKEVVELVESRGVLDRVVEYLKLGDRWSVDRETAMRVLKENMSARVVPDTRLVEVKVTLTGKVDARDAAAQIPVSLKVHLTDTVKRENDEKAREIDGLIREAADAAEEKATALAALEKVHGPKPEESAVAVKHQRASRESLLADAEVERLRNLRSACLTDNLDELPKLTIHSEPTISEMSVNRKGGDLGHLALRCLITGLLSALLLPYLMELAFPPRDEVVSPPDPVDDL